ASVSPSPRFRCAAPLLAGFPPVCAVVTAANSLSQFCEDCENLSKSKPGDYSFGMKLTRALLPCFSILAFLAIGPKLQAAEPELLPAPWKHQDIGAVEVKGTAAFHNGGFTLKGSMDTWGTND